MFAKWLAAIVVAAGYAVAIGGVVVILAASVTAGGLMFVGGGLGASLGTLVVLASDARG